jgi:hypothetical protein
LAEWTVEESLKRVYSTNENDVLVYVYTGRLLPVTVESAAGFHLSEEGFGTITIDSINYRNSFVFWDIPPCSSLKVNRTYGERVASIFRVEE